MTGSASSVPLEIETYHFQLAEAFRLAASDRLGALVCLRQAFDCYLEAAGLRLGIELLTPWPKLAGQLAHLSWLLYPEEFAAAEPGADLESGLNQDLGQDLGQGLPPELAAWLSMLFPAQRPRLSVCMIVRNESRALPAALASVAELADEIVVVDTGSTDGTQALAAAHAKVRLQQMVWIEDFAAARNFSLAKATGDWVMILDADEILLPESLAYLRAFFAFAPLGWQIYTCQINHELPDGMFFSWTTRIFRRDAAIKFVGAIHEMPRKFSEPGWMLQLALPAILRHSGNLPDVYQRQQKSRRAQLLAAQVENPLTRTPFLTYHYAYLLVNGIDLPANPRLAQELLLQTLAEAERDQGRVTPPERVPVSLAAVVLLLAQLWAQQGHFSGVASLYQRFAGICRVTAFAALGAMVLTALNQLDEAKIAWLRCFDPGLLPIREHESWQQQALENLLQIGLRQQDGFLALWATRRLRERFPDGRIPGRDFELIRIQRQLEGLLSLERGTWIDRLDFEIRRALERRDIQAVCFFAMAYLCEAWNHTVLGDAVRALHVLGAPALAHAVASLARDLYPEEELFQAFGVNPGAEAGLDLAECRVPGGAYWLYLARPPRIRPRVSLCMIVRNAADTLPDALASLAELVDEYVIADTGSADATPAIIAAWAENHRVLSWHQPWTDDFAAARNAVMARASGDWVLIVDADETLTPESIPRLRRLFAYAPAGLQLFAIRCASVYPDLSLTSEDWVPRVYQRNGLIRYWGAVHNVPGHAADAERLPVVPLAGIKLMHTGFLPAMVQKHNKSERLQRLERILTIAELPNPYFLYHYGYALMYQYDPPQLDKAFAVLEQSLSESLRWQQRPPVPGWFSAPLRKAQLLIFRLLAHWQDDQALMRRYARERGSTSEEPEYHYWYATAALRQGDLAAAKAGFLRAIASRDPGQPGAGFGSWKSRLGLTEVALQAHDWSGGIEVFQALLAEPGPLEAQRLFSEWWVRLGEREEGARGAGRGARGGEQKPGAQAEPL